MPKEKFFCANCMNCIVIRQYESDPERFVLRVRCTKKQWTNVQGRRSYTNILQYPDAPLIIVNITMKLVIFIPISKI